MQLHVNKISILNKIKVLYPPYVFYSFECRFCHKLTAFLTKAEFFFKLSNFSSLQLLVFSVRLNLVEDLNLALDVFS